MIYKHTVTVYSYCSHSDINECAEHTDQCDESHAECSNIIGGYECKCNVGFSGDGRHCGKL